MSVVRFATIIKDLLKTGIFFLDIHDYVATWLQGRGMNAFIEGLVPGLLIIQQDQAPM